MAAAADADGIHKEELRPPSSPCHTVTISVAQKVSRPARLPDQGRETHIELSLSTSRCTGNLMQRQENVRASYFVKMRC